jgi:SAM-dependent methyltransferase
MNKSLLLHLNTPHSLPKSDYFLVQGWIASSTAIESIAILEGENRTKLLMVEYPEVIIGFPEYKYGKGFSGLSSKKAINRNKELTFEYISGDISKCIVIDLNFIPSVVPAIPINIKNKIIKRNKLKNYLQCPICKGKLNEHLDLCQICHQVYEHGEYYLNFLLEKVIHSFNVIKFNSFGENSYSPIALSIINKHKNGLVLDCGAGCKEIDYLNVINFEMADYESTDILGKNECLPFKDQAFDAVLSNSVLEHVENPFLCAKEIMRVLKKGGDLYCVVAFLKPYHPQPMHYYNMAYDGLKNLFNNQIDVNLMDIPLLGQPINALSWILNSWISGLPEVSKKKFLDMRIKDLCENPLVYLNQDFVSDLTKEKKFELACTIMLKGKKMS